VADDGAWCNSTTGGWRWLR
jgi:hypothetical protein